LPVAVGDFAGDNFASFGAGVWSGDQDMPCPLLAQVIDRFRVVLIEIEGILTQDAEQRGRRIQRGIVAGRGGGSARSGVGRFFVFVFITPLFCFCLYYPKTWMPRIKNDENRRKPLKFH